MLIGDGAGEHGGRARDRGGWGDLTVSPWLVVLVLAGGLFLPAYNLELAGGRFHSDIWFALGWGAFPAFTGYFANSLEVGAPGLLIAAACTAMSLAQRRLSSAARELRRRTVSVEGTRSSPTEALQEISLPELLAPLDGALAAAVADDRAARGRAARARSVREARSAARAA